MRCYETKPENRLYSCASADPNVAAHFKRMLERPSVKKLLADEKEVNEGFANTAYHRLSQTHAVAEKWKSEPLVVMSKVKI